MESTRPLLSAKQVSGILNDVFRSSMDGYIVLDRTTEIALPKAKLVAGRFELHNALTPVPTGRWLAYRLMEAAREVGKAPADYSLYTDTATMDAPLTKGDIEKLTTLFGHDPVVRMDLVPALERVPRLGAEEFRAHYLSARRPVSRVVLKPASAPKPAGASTTATVTATIPDWVQKVTPDTAAVKGPGLANSGARSSDIPVLLDEGDQFRVQQLWHDVALMANALGWSPAEFKREMHATGFYIKAHEIKALNENRYATTTRPSLVMGLMRGIARLVEANAQGYEAAVAVSPPRRIVDPHRMVESANRLRADIAEHYPNPHGLPSRER